MTVDIYNKSGCFVRYTNIMRVVRTSKGSLMLWQAITLDKWEKIEISKRNYSWFEVGNR